MEEQASETRQQRINRELIELLNELRVALPGVQVLFAFLLAVPFSNGYTRTTSFRRAVFRNQEKEQLLLTSNRFMIVGLAFLAISMIGVVVLVADVVYSSIATVVLGSVAALVFGGLWFGLPLARRRS